MNLHVYHTLQVADLIKINNLLASCCRRSGHFVWKQPLTATNQKIQVEDQCLNAAGNPVGHQVKCSIYMPIYSACNAVLNQPLFAVEHAYGIYQQVRNMNPKKHYELFSNLVIGTVATRLEKVITDHVQHFGLF